MLGSEMDAGGRVTIPAAIRRKLNLRPHERLCFHVESGRVWIEAEPKRAASLFAKYHRPGMAPVSLEQMECAVKRRPS